MPSFQLGKNSKGDLESDGMSSPTERNFRGDTETITDTEYG